MRYLFTLLCLSFVFATTPVFAADAPSVASVSGEAIAVAPTPASTAAVTLTTDQLKQLLAASTVPAATPAPAKTAVISEIGVFGLSWSTVGSILAAILGVVFMFWKGATAVRVQKAVPDAIDAAYWFVERNFGDLPGPQKFLMALGHLYEGLTGHGLTLSDSVRAKATTRWELLANDPSGAMAPPPSAQAMADAEAKAKAAKFQASPDVTATDLAERASK